MCLYDTHYDRPMPNKFNGDIRMLQSEIKITSANDKLPNSYMGHYIFNIKRADRPFRTTYTGYYGLGAV